MKSAAADVLLISRIQGVEGSYREIQLATKTMHDVAPNALLLAALQGIADAFSIGEIVAVSAVKQTSYTEESAADFRQAYDSFFSDIGILKTADGFFRTSVPIETKPLAQIKRRHKLRTKDKRAFKHRIQVACAAFFAEQMQDSTRGLPR